MPAVFLLKFHISSNICTTHQGFYLFAIWSSSLITCSTQLPPDRLSAIASTQPQKMQTELGTFLLRNYFSFKPAFYCHEHMTSGIRTLTWVRTESSGSHINASRTLRTVSVEKPNLLFLYKQLHSPHQDLLLFAHHAMQTFLANYVLRPRDNHFIIC